MKLVTINIRYDCGHDGANNFSHRKAVILEKILAEQPDIICFQEVLPHVAEWLKESLPDYYIVGCPRWEPQDNEQVCIAFRWKKYNLMKMDTFWLSPTPSVPGSRYPEQSICPRVCTGLTLQEFASGQVFRVLNTHLDHEGAPARLRAAQQLLNYLETEMFFPGIPTILAGDMNAEPESEEMQLLSRKMRNAAAAVGHTFHNYGRGEFVQIDYIFTSEDILCRRAEKWTDCRDGVYLSDHYPVCAILEFS